MPKIKRRFPRSHTFKITAVFTCPVRVSYAQSVVRRKMAAHEFFGDGFKITKVRRMTRR
jgi:hypothetical protein